MLPPRAKGSLKKFQPIRISRLARYRDHLCKRVTFQTGSLFRQAHFSGRFTSQTGLLEIKRTVSLTLAWEPSFAWKLNVIFKTKHSRL